MLDSKTVSFKDLFRLVWLFCRRKAVQRHHILLILEAYEQQDQS